MGVLRIMSVGKSGVGKSTIGNCMIGGSPTAGNFHTSSSSESCTQDSKWEMSKDCQYCDVPGIPDTDAGNTKHFYDILITQARKELNVIFFVFKYERIDEDIYSKARMLFRELTKTKAIKVLIINDMVNYGFSAPPTPKDYQDLATKITDCTGLEFLQVVNVTTATLATKLANLKTLLMESKSYASPKLKTYVELKAYVADLEREKNHEEVAVAEQKAEIEKIKNTLMALEATAAGAAAAAAAASIGAFFTFGATLGIATPSAMAAAAAIAAIEIKKAELTDANNKISEEGIRKAKENLEKACKSFKELDDALNTKK